MKARYVFDMSPKSVAILIAVTFASTMPASARSDTIPSSVPLCSSQRIVISTDAEGGDFDGMSHSGTLLVVRNVAMTACRIAPFASITFEDRNGKPLDIAVERTSPFTGPVVNGHRLPLGHGPVVLPMTLPPGAIATSRLRWVSSPVFDRSVCLKPAHLSVDLGASAAQTSIAGMVCGADATHVSITADRLTLQ